MTRAECVARCREKLPAEMKEACRWLLYKVIPNGDKKPRKVPYYVSGEPRNGAMDTPEDVAQFATFDDAARAFQAGRYAGLGFALGRDGGGFWQGIDLDHLSEHPELQGHVDAVCATTYCEISPNEDGLHAIGYGQHFAPMGSTSDGIETYSSGRFFTVTGNALSTLAPVDLHHFVETELRPRRKPQASQPAGDGVVADSVTPETIRDLRSALLSMRADDRDLWIKLGLALFLLGDVGRGLWLEWSASSEKFDPLDAARTWDSFKRTQTDYRVVFAQAQRNGWVNTASKRVGSDTGDFQGAGDATARESVDFSLGAFALNGSSAAMKEKMLQDKYVAGRLAIWGQITFWYAFPNIGKTLLILWLLIDAIKRGVIDARDIYYVNADDNHKGLTYKTELAEHWGFNIIAPGYNGFKPDRLAAYIGAMINTGNARGKIIVLDTVKKFADLMDKTRGSKFAETLRQFSMHGGTVIGLAHVNKHRDDSGGVVYSGTTDLVDDCDCAYTLDVVTSDKTSGLRTVKFTNIKNRGDVALEAVYEYNFSEGLNFAGKLHSVRPLSDDEKHDAAKRRALDNMLERNREAVDVIKQCIRDGITNKTALIKAAVDVGCLRKTAVVQALKEHAGNNLADYQFWHVDVRDKNAHVYVLNVDPCLCNEF